MEVGRRGFFGLLGASALPLEVEGGVVREEKKKDEGFFVLEHPELLSDYAHEAIQKHWLLALGPNPPKLVILEEGMKLKHSSNL